MKMMTSRKALIPMITMMFISSTTWAQPTANCASQLIPCQAYMNSTSPPISCCQPLKDAITNDLPCLCSIFNDPTILKAFNIDLNAALQLPMHCGMPSLSSTNACAKYAAGAPGASTVPPPATPGDNSSAANSTSWIGLSSLLTVLIFCYSIMA